MSDESHDIPRCDGCGEIARNGLIRAGRVTCDWCRADEGKDRRPLILRDASIEIAGRIGSGGTVRCVVSPR